MLVHMSRVKFACYMRSLCETLRCASPRLSYSSAVERHVVQCGLGVVDMLRVLRVMFPPLPCCHYTYGESRGMLVLLELFDEYVF